MSSGAMGELIYRLLLRAYPAEFRNACEHELIGYFHRDRSHPRYRGVAGNLKFWRHTLADWARTSWNARRHTDPGALQRRQPPQRHGGQLATGLSWLRQAARGLWRDPAYFAIAVVTLAIGMSVTTVVFTLVNGLLLTPLPLPEPHRLVQVEERQRGAPGKVMAAYGNWADLSAESDAFEELAAFAFDSKTLTGVDAAVRLRSREVSENFFAAIGVPPALGRGFNPDELVAGQNRVVVLSHAVWSDVLGADPDILGRTIQLDATPYTVVGVQPPGFDFPAADIWVPLVPPAADRMRRSHRFRMTGRLADGVELRQAQESLDVIGARLEQQFPDTNEGDFYVVYPLLDEYVGEARPALQLLSGAVGLVLLIACVNIAGLSLARSKARRREIAMRRALGASRPQLAGLVLSEGLVLGAAGGLVGLPLAYAGVRLLLALAGSEIPRVENVSMSVTVFAFAAAASLLSALLASLLPLLHEARTSAGAVTGSRAPSAGSRIAGRRALVVGEVALAVVLVTAAGLLARSLTRLSAVRIGVESNDVLTMNIMLAAGKYPERIDTARFFDRLLPEIEALPGVESAAVTLNVPANPYGWYNSLTIRGREVPENEQPSVSYVVVSPGYFETLGIPLVEGRGLLSSDNEGDAPVAVINRTAAQRYWPGSSPIGALILGRAGEEDSWARVVGVVEDVRQSLYEPASPEVYVPISQDRVLGFILLARVRGEPLQQAAAVRAAVNDADPDIPVTGVMSLDDRIGEHFADARISAGLMSAFGAIALALAAVGVYGTLSYSVSLRRAELGIRVAVGATRGRVVGMVLREAMLIAAVAVAAGITAALALGRTISGLLFEVNSSDPLTLATVGVTVAAVTVAAALAPAWRAGSAEPLIALRGE